ncbi:sulfotransferase family protein [Luteimonas cucumeris]|uniref:Sulfotransferase family protein n=1 Tax=Luteimonas cucumeris TaxID=985012 RepID=A0A562LFD0_9GAMM|nr:sulfotransferase [Luteimonas cucumeris]TWI06322.1 sulfotransferase family protein [Luteimonas cucumeris]
MLTSAHASALQRAEYLLNQRDLVAARLAYESLLVCHELAALAHLRLSLIASATQRYRDSVDHAVSAYDARMPDADLLEMICKRLMTVGEMKLAIACAQEPALLQTKSPAKTAEIGKLMSDAFQPELALRLLEMSRANGLDTPAVRYLIGLSQMYAGSLEAAESELESCLQADPDFAPAYWAVSKLGRQGSGNHHVERLRAAIARCSSGRAADLPLLYYSLFKELDGLGDTRQAWLALSEGMHLRRKLVRYDADVEQRLFVHLSGLSRSLPSDPPPHEGAVPIFIIGMPRSGTTLLERILGGHPDIADAGELHDLVWQLRWICDKAGAPFLDQALAERAEDIDWPQLGRRYLAHTQWRARGRAFYTDKMPANFINVSYVLRAIPNARILHMIRDPMDTCFSNLKELFAGPYPHSYDMLEMADHYRHYRRLMAHWHALFPGRILDVQYADLAADPERIGREVIAFCGLSWNEGMAAIEKRTDVTTTASAMQVREPIHTRFVGQWYRYAEYLEPMRERLGAMDQ